MERQPQVPNILRLPSEPRLALPKAVSCRPQCRSCRPRRARQRRVPGGISAGGCAGVQGCLKQACPASPGCLATDGRLAFGRWTQASDRHWQRWFWLERRQGSRQENTSISTGCLGFFFRPRTPGCDIPQGWLKGACDCHLAGVCSPPPCPVARVAVVAGPALTSVEATKAWRMMLAATVSGVYKALCRRLGAPRAENVANLCF